MNWKKAKRIIALIGATDSHRPVPGRPDSRHHSQPGHKRRAHGRHWLYYCPSLSALRDDAYRTRAQWQA